MIAQRVLSGILFEFDSPSCLRVAGLPIEVRSTGRAWELELLWRDQRTQREFRSRNEAVEFLAGALQGTAFITYGGNNAV